MLGDSVLAVAAGVAVVAGELRDVVLLVVVVVVAGEAMLLAFGSSDLVGAPGGRIGGALG